MVAIPTVTLNDGRRIPQVGFGVFQIPADETERAVSAALEAGYRHIDTARAYNNEEGVGAAITSSGIPREELFITTKLRNNDREDPRAAIEDSLRRLGLDYVDLYLIHWPVPADGHIEAIWQQFQAFQHEGLARSIGVSNFRAEDLETVLRTGDVAPAVNQIECHPTFQNHALANPTLAENIAVEAYSPLGQGADLDAQAVAQAADAHGVNVGQVIIRWHVQHGRIVIPKSNSADRIASNLQIDGFELSAGEMAAIDALDAGKQIGRDPATFDWPQTGPLPKDWKPGMRPEDGAAR